MTESTGNLSAVHIATSRQHIPVTVILERRMVSRSFWRVPVWRLGGVLVGEHLSHEPKQGPALHSRLREPVTPVPPDTGPTNARLVATADSPVDVADAGDDQPGGADAIRNRHESVDAFSWAGFSVTLYRDACERYWHALIGDQPRVYVICHEMSGLRDGSDHQEADTRALLRPVKVTVNYDEAIACGDTDQQVLSAPIPGELYRHMESFVLTHYKPQVFKKRKRRNWQTESEQSARAPDMSLARHGKGQS